MAVGDLCLPPAEVAVGVHTWTEGFLSPVYRDLLDY